MTASARRRGMLIRRPPQNRPSKSRRELTIYSPFLPLPGTTGHEASLGESYPDRGVHPLAASGWCDNLLDGWGRSRILGLTSVTMEVFGNPVSEGHAARFPSHGWAVDVAGDHRLFFPILTVFEGAAAIRTRAGVEEDVGITHRLAAQSFTRTLWKLAVVLRDLEGLARAGWARGDHAEFVAAREAFDRAPLLIEWAFGYLRRLAERFALAAAPVLFQHLNSTPRDFPKLFRHAENRFSALGPLVNGEDLQQLLNERSGWLKRLRKPGGGFRDRLEHDPVAVDVLLFSDRGGDDGVKQWLEAVMSDGPTDELVGVLRELCADLCDFLTGVCRLVRYANSYRYDDGLLISGPEELVLAFWPEI